MVKQSINIFCVIALLCLSFHFIRERVENKEHPTGDEGSWMAAASQLAHGHGFTTNWLEHTFLKPDSLPRPDDYRYPGLVSLLAAGFMIHGTSYPTALWTVAFVFLVFEIMVYLSTLLYFGKETALLTLFVTVISLNQLAWNTEVLTEGLFGIVCALILITSRFLLARSLKPWAIIGGLCGLLYLVRPNGILIAAGILFFWLYYKGSIRYKKGGLIVFALCLLLVVSPWLIRSYRYFGNPFHIAGSAGLLRTTAAEPLTLSFSQFVGAHGLFYPAKAIGLGTVAFFKQLNTFDHGLQWIPLIGMCVGFLMKKHFYNAFATAGFLLSFAACSYASYRSYAGLRYFSALLPFVYAYGLDSLLCIVKQSIPQKKQAWYVVFYVAVAIGLFACVYYPHKYYERIYSGKSGNAFECSRHLGKLNTLLGSSGCYFAASMAQWNFLTDYKCVGVQDVFDSATARRMLDKNGPVLGVFTEQEVTSPEVISLAASLEKNGYGFRPVDSYMTVSYFVIDKVVSK